MASPCELRDDRVCILPLAIRPAVVGSTGVLGLYVNNHALGVFMVAINAVSSLRLMKMTRYLLGTRVLTRTIYRSTTALVIPFYLLFMLLTFFGTLVRPAHGIGGESRMEP